MLKQDYIETIAAYIVESWDAADAGDRAASSTAKNGAMRVARQAAEELGQSAGYWLAESQFRAADLYYVSSQGRRRYIDLAASPLVDSLNQT